MSKELADLSYCNEALKLEGDISGAYLELGKRLLEIRESRRFLGSWETFEDYLMEFRNLSSATASKLINIYQRFVLEYEVPTALLIEAGGWSKAAELLPVANTKKEALHWIKLAAQLTQSDLRRSIKEARTGVDMGKCKHTDTYILEVCRTCGVRHKVIK